MGRTLPSITIVFYREIAALEPFRHAICCRDQLALDELYSYAQKHLAEAAYAAHAFPIKRFILAILIEEYKEVMRIRRQIKGWLNMGQLTSLQ